MKKKNLEKYADEYRMRPSQMIGWSGRAVSIAVNVVVLMQITYYCTNILGMSPVLVGTLLMASKIFDGITDIFAGLLIDRTNTKWGKARPYEISILFVWVATILLYSCPELGTVGQGIWIFAIYTFINSICVTLLNASEPVYLVRAFKYEDDRNKLLSINGLIVMALSILAGVAFPIMMGTLGTTRGGWTTMMLIMGIPMMVIGMGRFLLVKEKVDTTANNTESITFKDYIPAMSNKYIWIFCVLTLLGNFVTYAMSSVGTYYFDYVVGDITMMSVVNMISIVTPLLLLVMPKVLQKISVKTLFVISYAVGVIAGLVRFAAGANMPLLIVGNLLQGVSTLGPSYYTVLLLLDIMDYHEWKTGVRVEGVMASINSFAAKIASALASGGVGMIMGLCGFDGTLAVQSETAMGSIYALYCWVPSAIYLVMIFLMRAFDLDKKIPEIRKELELRRAGNP